MRYIVCYDIRENRRLQRTHRLLSGYALPLQKSVFMFIGDEKQFSKMTKELCNTVDLQEDDIRIYKLGKHAEVWEWGYRAKLEGVFLAV